MYCVFQRKFNLVIEISSPLHLIIKKDNSFIIMNNLLEYRVSNKIYLSLTENSFIFEMLQCIFK